MRFKSPTPSVTRSLQTAAMLAGLIGCVVALSARAETLTIGSPAPAIDVEHWFHDYEPVTAFEKGRVYVVEFWATWCGPCVASMPRLAEIQERFPDDVVIISISSEEPAKIEEFLDRKKGDTTYREITSVYRLATDPDRSVNNDYMRAAGQNGHEAAPRHRLPPGSRQTRRGDCGTGETGRGSAGASGQGTSSAGREAA